MTRKRQRRSQQHELWKSDDTTADTVMVTDLNAAAQMGGGSYSNKS